MPQSTIFFPPLFYFFLKEMEFEMRAHVAPENQLVAAGLNNTFSCRRHLIILLHESGKILPLFFFFKSQETFRCGCFLFLKCTGCFAEKCFVSPFFIYTHIYIFLLLSVFRCQSPRRAQATTVRGSSIQKRTPSSSRSPPGLDAWRGRCGAS